MRRLDGDFRGSAEVHIPEGTTSGSTKLTLTAGEIGPAEREFFGQSHCHWLAGAIGCMTGWDLVGVKLHYPEKGWTSVHTAVLAPDGSVLDIYGRHDSMDAFAEQYRRQTGLEPAVTRIPPGQLFHGHLTSDDTTLAEDPYWWTRTDTDPRVSGLYQHFARLVITRAGYRVPKHCRPAPAPGTTPTATTMSGGTTLSSVEEIRAQLDAADARAQGVAGALVQAVQEIHELQGHLAQAAGGSTNAAVNDAMGLYGQAQNLADDAASYLQQARVAVQTYAVAL